MEITNRAGDRSSLLPKPTGCREVGIVIGNNAKLAERKSKAPLIAVLPSDFYAPYEHRSSDGHISETCLPDCLLSESAPCLLQITGLLEESRALLSQRSLGAKVAP